MTEIQASEAELTKALKDRRILLINGSPSFQIRRYLCPEVNYFVGTLRPIAASYLSTILELLLNSLVSLQEKHNSASVRVLADTLQDEHDIRPQVTKQVMGWFGDADEHRWKMDVPSVLKQVGLGILRTYRVYCVLLQDSLKSLTSRKHDPTDENEFLDKWRDVVGDTFASQVNLSLLSVRPFWSFSISAVDHGQQGNYLTSIKPQSYPPSSQLTYFPSSELPLEPLPRFNDLFLTRSRWKAEEIAPFLDDIAIDRKERDKLLLKYARAITTPNDGTYYTSRTIK